LDKHLPILITKALLVIYSCGVTSAVIERLYLFTSSIPHKKGESAGRCHHVKRIEMGVSIMDGRPLDAGAVRLA